IPIAFAGQRVQLHGYLRLEDVTGFVALWIREDAGMSSVGFNTLQNLQLKGTADWKEYSVDLPLNPEARTLFFGFLLSGTGKAWVDDSRLMVDGKPVWEAPKVERPKTVLDTDTEFDRGSGISLGALTPEQTANLATLGKVWGFLKYHH